MRGVKYTEPWNRENVQDAIEFIQGIAAGDQYKLWLAAIVIVIVTAIVSRLVTKLLRRVLAKDGSPLPSSSILVNIARVAIWVTGLSVMLSACFSIDVNGLIAALGIGGIALSLGLQDTIKNFIGGLQVTLMKIVEPGDHIKVGGVDGIVQDVSWRQTIVKDYENGLHFIPNAIINTSEVEKVEPRFAVSTAIAFRTDMRDIDSVIREMELLAKRAVEKVADLEKDPWILLTQIGEYGAWGKLRFVLKDVAHAREARDAALRAIAPYTCNDAKSMLHDEGEED